MVFSFWRCSFFEILSPWFNKIIFPQFYFRRWENVPEGSIFPPIENCVACHKKTNYISEIYLDRYLQFLTVGGYTYTARKSTQAVYKLTEHFENWLLKICIFVHELGIHVYPHVYTYTRKNKFFHSFSKHLLFIRRMFSSLTRVFNQSLKQKILIKIGYPWFPKKCASNSHLFRGIALAIRQMTR